MKKIILAFALLFAITASKAQTGLQFSQALLPNGVLGITQGSTINLGTVPAGKVWKFENYLNSYAGCVSLIINGSAGNTLPSDVMWFPAGTQLSILRTCTVSAGNASTIFCSILEFTIVP